MMHPFRRAAALAAFLLLCMVAQDATAGGWTRKKKSYYVKFSANYLSTTREFNHLGEKLNIFQERIVYEDTSFRDFNLHLYAEYGIADWLTLLGTLPLKSLQSKRVEVAGGGLIRLPVETNTTGLSDLWLATRTRLLDGPFVASIQTGVKLPLGYDARPSNDGAPLGTSEVDFDVQLLLGKSLHPVPIYVTGGAGYRFRGGPLQDEYIFQIEAGFRAGRTLFKVSFDGIYNARRPIPDIVGTPVTTPLPGGGGVLPNIIVGDQDIYKLSPSIIYALRPGTQLQLEMLNIVAGKNTISGSSWSLGVVLER